MSISMKKKQQQQQQQQKNKTFDGLNRYTYPLLNHIVLMQYKM